MDTVCADSRPGSQTSEKRTLVWDEPQAEANGYDNLGEGPFLLQNADPTQDWVRLALPGGGAAHGQSKTREKTGFDTHKTPRGASAQRRQRSRSGLVPFCKNRRFLPAGTFA